MAHITSRKKMNCLNFDFLLSDFTHMDASNKVGPPGKGFSFLLSEYIFIKLLKLLYAIIQSTSLIFDPNSLLKLKLGVLEFSVFGEHADVNPKVVLITSKGLEIKITIEIKICTK